MLRLSPKPHHLLVIVWFAAIACTPSDETDTDPQATSQTRSNMPIQYPKTATVEHVDYYHNVAVPDPYRWLEEDVRESERVADWVAAENAVTEAYLATIAEREDIKTRLRELWDYERFGVPWKKGGRYFYTYNDGLANQNQVYMLDALDDPPQLVLDPNTWSEDGTIALAGFAADPTGRYAAYLIQDGGSDWRTAKVRDLANGEDLADQLRWLKFTSVNWRPDGSGFYYSRYPQPADGAAFQALNVNHALYFHAIGTPQTEDTLIFTDPDHPKRSYGSEVTDDGRFLVITSWISTDDRYEVRYRDLTDEGGALTTLVEGFEYRYSLIDNVGTQLYFLTDRDAPKARIVVIDVGADTPEWREIVAEADDVLESVSHVGGKLIAQYLEDAKTAVRMFTLSGEPTGTIPLPGIGSAVGFGGVGDEPETFYQYSSFNAPPTIYRYDVASNETDVFRAAQVSFDPSEYTVSQKFYQSKDGTRVPIFLAHKRGVRRDASNHTLLTGYGGFAISLTPYYSTTYLAWMEMGGILAMPNLRGGGEYGKAWHKAGTKLQKQNVFDDFIAAAEFLIEERYTRPDKLAIAGGSNGGLLVGAVLNQRPELFGAAIPAVGVMDMLRFHRFTAGRFWTDDYGSSEDPDEFEALYAYSPYHNIDPAKDYPAVLVTTADTDDRVVPGHSFKYIAALQAVQNDDPTLIRIETRAGHGLGTPTEKIIEDYADRWAFLVRNLDVD